VMKDKCESVAALIQDNVEQFSKQKAQKGGWSPIPAFSHREPPFCVAQRCYLFLAPFFAAAFLAGAFLAAFAPFLAVAIAYASPFLRFVPYTRCCVLTDLVY
jgi:hypothetical protein